MFKRSLKKHGNPFSKRMRRVKLDKKTTIKDVSQDIKISKLNRQVAKLNAGAKGWNELFSISHTYQAIPTLVGVNSNTSLGGFVMSIPFNLAQGDDNFQRQGDSITASYIDIHYDVIPHAGAFVGTQAQDVRVMLVCFKKPNGTPATAGGSSVPTWNDLFAYNSSSNIMAQSHVLNMYNPFTRPNYKVYYNRLHKFNSLNVDPGDTGTKAVQAGRIRVRPKKGNSQVTYNDTTAIIANQEKNMFVLLAFSNNSTAVDATPASIKYQGISMYQQ